MSMSLVFETEGSCDLKRKILKHTQICQTDLSTHLLLKKFLLKKILDIWIISLSLSLSLSLSFFIFLSLSSLSFSFSLSFIDSFANIFAIKTLSICQVRKV